MKLTSLQIDDFRQFKDFRLDLTDPETGKPLEKVCFIGPNGTGKSTLLAGIAGFAWEGGLHRPVGVEVLRNLAFRLADATGKETDAAGDGGTISGLRSLAVYCPPDADAGTPLQLDLPTTSLSSALSFSDKATGGKLVSLSEASTFWTRLISHLKLRERKLLEFQRLPENRRKAIEDIEAEFDRQNPKVLDGLICIWNSILTQTQLEFDHESIEEPVQLSDNLKAYLRTRQGKQRVPYSDLSTGIRHYLFRLGHIWSLYFNREPGDSLLLVDEPEGSLYPDFLYDIVRNYQEVAPGCQLFMATHSPIVAAQFRPEERVILNFGDDGKVTARRGVSPEGDDPNDILRQDFGVDSLMTEKGEQAYDRFLKLRRLIPASKEPEKTILIEEYTRLGSAYHFQAPSSQNEGAA